VVVPVEDVVGAVRKHPDRCIDGDARHVVLLKTY
jgi:hypothetical protein